jgi:hypothetical protein
MRRAPAINHAPAIHRPLLGDDWQRRQATPSAPSVPLRDDPINTAVAPPSQVAPHQDAPPQIEQHQAEPPDVDLPPEPQSPQAPQNEAQPPSQPIPSLPQAQDRGTAGDEPRLMPAPEPPESQTTNQTAPPTDPVHDSSPSEQLNSDKPVNPGAKSELRSTPDAEKPAELNKIIVRELRIDPHGFLRDPDSPQNDEPVAQSTQPEASAPPTQPQPVSPTSEEVKRDYTGFPTEPLQLTRSVRSMQRTMRACLQSYYARPEVANKRSNWGMLHSIMVYGVDTRVIVGRNNYSAIAWIAGNNACRGQKLLSDGPDGIQARNGVGLQGHQAQMLAVFAQCDVPTDYPLYADKGKFTVGDVLAAEMADCRSKAELTFTLIALSHYLDTDDTWVDSNGGRWDFERLIREELSQPIVGAACGGTHRLMGFAHALRKRRAEGKPISGQWKRAELFTEDFQSYCYRLQNRDGSMSTDWFEGREDNGDLDRKIQTTGHMVEWLLTVTPDSQLQNTRLVNAVRFLLNSMYSERNRDWSIGPKGHALRSLAMYYERVYRSGPAWQSQLVARRQQSSQR